MTDKGYVVEQMLRNQIPLTDSQLMVQLDRIGLRPYQFDIGKHDEVLLRLPYELLRVLVQMQETAPLSDTPIVGTAKGRRGHVLVG